MAESTPVVGFIGLGAIGRPMAMRLADGGANLVVYNRTRSRTDPFQGKAIIAETAAEVADRADIVMSCLTTPQSYDDMILGPQGIIHGKRMKIYVHTGTNETAVLTKIETALKAKGVATVDAPITGGVDGAAQGKLTVMAAGPKDAFDKAEPFFKLYSAKIVYLGERVGAAQFTKLVNNLLSAANLALASEAVVMGCKAGVDMLAMMDVINNGSGQNSATSSKLPKQVLTRAFKHGASLEMMVKDVKAFLVEAKNLHVPAPLGQAVLESYNRAVAEEGADADVTTVLRPMERAAGIEIPKVL